MSGLDRTTLEWVLDHAGETTMVTPLWQARDRRRLDEAAAQAMSYLNIWSRPETIYHPKASHARVAFLTYIVSSTYELRRNELRDMDWWKA